MYAPNVFRILNEKRLQSSLIFGSVSFQAKKQFSLISFYLSKPAANVKGDVSWQN